MRVLLISNGSGEDRIAAQLGHRWRACQSDLQLQALALVGQGLFYQQAQIELLPPRFMPPSQGFAYLDPKLLWQDFKAGLGTHLVNSLSCLKSLRGQFDAVLAVGDIVAVLAAEMTQTPYAFVGCALSDYYLGDQTRRSTYDPLQRLLLKRSQALVFARDRLTADNLRRHGLNAHFEGNPMLDCFDPAEGICAYQKNHHPLVLLLPGSHADAEVNFALMLKQLRLSLNQPAKDFVVLCAPQLALAPLKHILQAAGWQADSDCWQQAQARLWLLESQWFKTLLREADLAIGLAGTANEQCVGQGLPVMSFASQGQQYTWAFGEAQQRLLGAGLSFLGDPHPELIAWQLQRMLSPSYKKAYRSAAEQTAAERFGKEQADLRIIDRCRAEFQKQG